MAGAGYELKVEGRRDRCREVVCREGVGGGGKFSFSRGRNSLEATGISKQLETFLAGALYREFREFMRILTTFLGKTYRNPS